MSLTLRRVARLTRTGSPRKILRAARRAVWLRRAGAELDAALRSDAPLVVGPFLGELGYELLYWRPYVLRLLRSNGVDPARVTVLGRGGSGSWYGEFASGAKDAFELMPPEEVRERTQLRARRAGERKQSAVDDLDRDLVRRASGGDPAAQVVHPLHMFWSWRFAWEGLRPPAEAVTAGDYDPLPVDAPPAAIASRLPERFVAVKAYFNECVADDAASRAAYARLVRKLAAVAPVVLLQPGFAADDHDDWDAGGAAVVRIDDALDPSTNLAVQAAVVARSTALVATYGGFCYLGPFLGVPVAGVGELGQENPNHERILRAALPHARYERFALGEPVRVAAFVRDAGA